MKLSWGELEQSSTLVSWQVEYFVCHFIVVMDLLLLCGYVSVCLAGYLVQCLLGTFFSPWLCAEISSEREVTSFESCWALQAYFFFFHSSPVCRDGVRHASHNHMQLMISWISMFQHYCSYID